MRPPDAATLIPEPTAARLVAVGLDVSRSGRIEVALLVDREPFALTLSRTDACRLLDQLGELIAMLPPEPEPDF
jgi:hypothetical protein